MMRVIRAALSNGRIRSRARNRSGTLNRGSQAGLSVPLPAFVRCVDIDPRNGGLDSGPLALDRMADDPPEIFGIAATPSHGAHFWIASQGVARTKLMKGIDLQAATDWVYRADRAAVERSRRRGRMAAV